MVVRTLGSRVPGLASLRSTAPCGFGTFLRARSARARFMAETLSCKRRDYNGIRPNSAPHQPDIDYATAATQDQRRLFHRHRHQTSTDEEGGPCSTCSFKAVASS